MSTSFLFDPLAKLLLSPMITWHKITISWGDAIATITGVIYVYLATQRKALAWLISLISITVYIIILPQSNLLANGIMQIIYFLMALYGWYRWYKPIPEYKNSTDTEKSIEKSTIPGSDIKTLSKREIYISLLAFYILAWIFIIFLHYVDPEPTIFWDAILAAGSLVFTVIEIGKYLETWLGWIVIDTLYIPLYTHQKLYLSAFLSALYVGFSLYGFIHWRKNLLNYRMWVHGKYHITPAVLSLGSATFMPETIKSDTIKSTATETN